MHCHALASPEIAVAGHGEQAVDEVFVTDGDRPGAPAEPVRVRLDLVEGRAAQRPVADPLEPLVRGGRHDPVHPGPPVGRARLGERRAADLLRIQAERGLLRRVAPVRHSTGHRFADELVAESGQVLELVRHRRLPRTVSAPCNHPARRRPPPTSAAAPRSRVRPVPRRSPLAVQPARCDNEPVIGGWLPQPSAAMAHMSAMKVAMVSYRGWRCLSYSVSEVAEAAGEAEVAGVAEARRRRAARTRAGSVVVQNGGSDLRRKSPYRAVTRRGSSTATTPRSVIVRSRRPAPWASSSAACDAATVMKPLPPRDSTARWRAEDSGSSGRGNGIRSMTTSCSALPGTSTPCHSDSVPKRQVSSDAANSLTSCAVTSSPWHSSG